MTDDITRLSEVVKATTSTTLTSAGLQPGKGRAILPCLQRYGYILFEHAADAFCMIRVQNNAMCFIVVFRFTLVVCAHTHIYAHKHTQIHTETYMHTDTHACIHSKFSLLPYLLLFCLTNALPVGSMYS